MEERKAKAVKAYVGKLFKDYWKMEQNMMDWKINPNMVSIKNQRQFFSYDFKKRSKPKRPSLHVDFSSVYHSLSIAALEDLSLTKKNIAKHHFNTSNSTS